MYHHLDQSWKKQPSFLEQGILIQLGNRLAEYVQETGLDRLIIIFHGGEPLLATSQKLIEASEIIRHSLPDSVRIDFTMQTNGVLLNSADAQALERHNIHISISLDGPASINDRHRLDHKGRSSYQKTLDAVRLMQEYPTIYAGLIAVIDAKTDPKELLEFFSELAPPSLDFLLPDANYLTLPPGRELDPTQYSQWLIRCFDEWFDHYPELRIRTFESILNGLLGLPSETDAFGLGDVSLLTIETDGSYHDLDVLKITGSGTNLKTGNVFSTSILEAAQSPALQKHRLLLSTEGLCNQCRTCPWVDLCGGGSVPHRFGNNGFDNPSIYCDEIYALIMHAQGRVDAQLAGELNEQQQPLTEITQQQLEAYEGEEVGNTTLLSVRQQWKQSQIVTFDQVLQLIVSGGSIEENQVARQLVNLPEEQRCSLAIQPSVVTWCEVLTKQVNGISMHSIDGQPMIADFSYILCLPDLLVQINKLKVHRFDAWLRMPFGDKIIFESELTTEENELVEKALKLICQWNPDLYTEIQAISPEIQFIRDTTAHPDKIVSFSDNSVPGALYIQIRKSTGLISVYDLADSIIHEHRHQKLYLLQRISPIVTQDFPLVHSPWREELRPPSGLFHALFVFVKLHSFWRFLATYQSAEVRNRAEVECEMVEQKLSTGFETVRSCPLTETGFRLLSILEENYSVDTCC